MVAAIYIRGEGDLVFAAQQDGGRGGDAAEGLPAASITYHLRSTLPAFASVVLMVYPPKLSFENEKTKQGPFCRARVYQYKQNFAARQADF